MRLQRFLIALILVVCQSVFADEILYKYEADVLPYDPSVGWEIYSPCLGTCKEAIDQGNFVLTWTPSGGRSANYTRVFGGSPFPPPPDPPFWVEWRFASNNTIHGSFDGDGEIIIGYNTAHGQLEMYGNAIVSGDGGTFVTGLPLNEFRTFRFESSDANQWCVWYDGTLFECGVGGQNTGLATYIQMYGRGESPTQTFNRWDYVRYGRQTSGETIVAADPPIGFLDPAAYSNLDRFTVTFDQPNYVYINDITVEVLPNQYRDREGAVLASGDVPTVVATRRQDNGPPDTVEIVLDRPLPFGQTTRFTFNTGAATPHTVEYTVAVDPHPIIPTMSSWGLVIFTLLLFIVAKILQVAPAAGSPASALSKLGP